LRDQRQRPNGYRLVVAPSRLGCHEVHLDPGVGTNRTAAHRLYLSGGYRISSHHFTRDC